MLVPIPFALDHQPGHEDVEGGFISVLTRAHYTRLHRLSALAMIAIPLSRPRPGAGTLH